MDLIFSVDILQYKSWITFIHNNDIKVVWYVSGKIP